MTRRPLIGIVAVVAVLAIALVYALASPASPASPTAEHVPATAPPRRRIGGSSPPIAAPPPTPRPLPKHELFGFVPYWEMDDDIADHLAKTPLTTLALFSVTHTKTGKLDTSQNGYKRITGAIGKQLIREAHDRDVAVQLVYTSFGTARNKRLFRSLEVQDADDRGARRAGRPDRCRRHQRRRRAARPGTRAGLRRVRRAAARRTGGERSRRPRLGGHDRRADRRGDGRGGSASGADRIFMMGYDYHYAGSDVGASAPMDRRDGAEKDLVWSLDLYEAVGVPVDKTILGLPLYGMRWRVAGPELGAPRLGNGAIWVPADNPRFLADPPAPPELDPIEIVEFYAVAPTVSPVPGDSRATAGWQAIYVDSPRTLEPKLALADDRGLAGAGFWAIGYERGMPDYTNLMKRFAAGRIQ